MHGWTRLWASVSIQTGVCVLGSIVFGSIVGLSGGKQASAGRLASAVLGWSYFAAWVVSFFPQVLLNQTRRSVTGLSRDMVALATFGFLCYLSYNAALYDTNSSASREYVATYGMRSGVTLPDVAFSAFGVAMNLVIVSQVIAFDRSDWWRLSYLWAGILAILVLAAAGGAFVASAGAVSWLAYVTALSWVKLAATLVKYAPQVVLNCRRKATTGFHVLGITLDLAGSVLSLAQLGLDCVLVGSFSLVVGDPAKFGLGLLTAVFDVILILQHCYYGPDSSHGSAVDIAAHESGTDPLLPRIDPF